MQKAMTYSIENRSPLNEIQSFFIKYPNFLDSKLMTNILPDSLQNDHNKAISALKTQKHIIHKILLTYNAKYYPEAVIKNLNSPETSQMINSMINELINNEPRAIEFFSIKQFRHITYPERYNDFIPYIEKHIKNCLKTGQTSINIIDIGCAPQSIELGAPALENLVTKLKRIFPQINFSVIGTDNFIPDELLKAKNIGKNRINYIKDSISETKFSNNKFDIVILCRVPIFNGISKNQTARTKAIENIFNMSKNGLLFFDGFISDTMAKYTYGKLDEAFIRADDELFEEKILAQENALPFVGMSFILDYTKLSALSNLAKIMDETLDDFLQEIQSYLLILQEIYLSTENAEKINNWFKKQCKDNFPKISIEKDINSIKQKLNIAKEKYTTQLNNAKQGALHREQENLYPWQELLRFNNAAKDLKIIEKCLNNPKKTYIFFNKLIKFLLKKQNKKMIEKLREFNSKNK